MLVCSASVYMLNMNMNIIFSLSLTFRSVDTLLLSDRSVVLCKQTNNHPSHKTNKQTKNRKQNKTKSTKKPFFPKTFQKIQSTYSVRHLSYFFYLWPQANANKKPYILSVIYVLGTISGTPFRWDLPVNFSVCWLLHTFLKTKRSYSLLQRNKGSHHISVTSRSKEVANCGVLKLVCSFLTRFPRALKVLD